MAAEKQRGSAGAKLLMCGPIDCMALGMRMMRNLFFCILMTLGSLAGAQNNVFDPTYLLFQHHLSLSALAVVEQPEDVQKKVIENSLDWIQNFHDQSVEVVVIRNREDWQLFQMTWMPMDNLTKDIGRIRKGEVNPTKRFQLVIEDPEVLSSVQKMDQESRARDLRVPQSWKTWLLNVALLRAPNRPIQTFDLLTTGGRVTRTTFALLRRQSFQKWRAPLDTLKEKHQKARLDLKNLGELLKKSVPQFSEKTNPGFRRLVELLVSGYFKRIPEDWIEEIIAAQALTPGDVSAQERLKIVFARCGPDIQKLLQIISRWEEIDPSVRESLSVVEDGTVAARWSYVESALLNHRTLFRDLQISPVPVKAGSMAQIHRGKGTFHDGTEVELAPRFIKPFIRERHLIDAQILADLAQDVDADPILQENKVPPLHGLVKDLATMVEEELDVARTQNAQLTAKEIYHDTLIHQGEDGVPLTLAIRVPEIYPTEPKNGREHTLLLQEWVNGVSFGKVKAENPVHARRIFQSFARLWISKALFKGFHYDIHPGNILIRKVSETEFVFYLLDHGMFAVLDEGRAIGLASTAAAVHRKNPELIAKSIWNLSDQANNQIQFPEFQKGIADYVEGKGDSSLQLHFVLGEALRKGVVLPPDMNRLSRGLTGLAMMGKWLGTTISISEITYEILTKNLGDAARSMGIPDLSDLRAGKVSPALKTAAQALGIHALATGKDMTDKIAQGASDLWGKWKNRNAPKLCPDLVHPQLKD